MNNDDFTVLVSGGSRCHWACILCGHHIQNDWVSRTMNLHTILHLSFSIPPQKLFGWFRRPQLWATGDWQLHQDNEPTHVSHLMQKFLANHPGDSAPYTSDLAPCDFWLSVRFTKIRQGQLMTIGRTVWGYKVPTFKGTEASLSCVQCFLYLVSSSINVSIDHSTWLDTFQTDLVYL